MINATEYHCKQFVAVVKNRFGSKFMVFTTGDPKYYLFSLVNKDGINTGIPPFPILKTDLRDDIKKALSKGWGNAGI